MNVPYFQNYAHNHPIILILELFSLKLLPIILKIIYAGTLGSSLTRVGQYHKNGDSMVRGFKILNIMILSSS